MIERPHYINTHASLVLEYLITTRFEELLALPVLHCLRGRHLPPPEKQVCAQDKQVPQHLQRIREDVQLAPGDLMPLDGHFVHGDSRLLREQQ